MSSRKILYVIRWRVIPEFIQDIQMPMHSMWRLYDMLKRIIWFQYHTNSMILEQILHQQYDTVRMKYCQDEYCFSVRVKIMLLVCHYCSNDSGACCGSINFIRVKVFHQAALLWIPDLWRFLFCFYFFFFSFRDILVNKYFMSVNEDCNN